MSWFKVDDNLHSHEKARGAGLAAMGLWAVSGSYSSAYLTEGWVPRWFVVGWPSGAKLAAKLVAAGLWDESDDGCWLFHQWDERNPSKEQVEAERAATKERQQKWRDTKRRNAERNGVTNSVTNGVTNTAPTRPDPTVVPKGTTQTGSLRSPAAAKRGTRLPDGWQPSTELVNQMHQECPAVDLRSEHRVFADYWAAQPGQRGIKADWDATWRNWMRKAVAVSTQTTRTRPSTTDAGIAAIQAMKNRDPQRLEIT